MSTSITLDLNRWNPDDAAYWKAGANRVANRNLWISIFSLFLSFSVWVIWSAVAVNLNSVGFSFTEHQLFMLVAVPPVPEQPPYRIGFQAKI